MPNNIGEILENVDLKYKNTYHLPSSAKYLISPANEIKLQNLLRYIDQQHLNFFVLGNGSNVILPNKMFDGVIISLKKMQTISLDIANNQVKGDAGVMLPVLAQYSIDHNLTGLEWAIGIPGTLGGAIYGNAGAYLKEMMECVKDVTIMDYKGNIKTIKKQDITYSYRMSLFKELKNCLIIAATLQLLPGNKEESIKIVNDRKARRLASQPLEFPSAGSVFRNPSKEIPAGLLIEQAGLKGITYNGAMVSLKHANFIINKNDAEASDVIHLIDLIKKEVKAQNNIELHCEQEIVKW